MESLIELLMLALLPPILYIGWRTTLLAKRQRPRANPLHIPRLRP